MIKQQQFYKKESSLNQGQIYSLFNAITGKNKIEQHDGVDSLYSPSIFFMNDENGNICLYYENTIERQLNEKSITH